MSEKQLDALKWYLSSEGSSHLEKNVRTTFIGAESHPALELFPNNTLCCLQTNFRKAELLRSRELTVSSEIDDNQELIIISGSKTRALNDLYLKEAIKNASTNATIIMSLEGALGGKSLAKKIRDRIPDIEVHSKAHSKIVVGSRESFSSKAEELFAKPRSTVSFNGISFSTHPAIFSWDAPDEGSLLLLEALPDSLTGMIADLGCGWGLLGVSLLLRESRPEQVHFFDIEKQAVDAVEQTTNDLSLEGARFHWTDLTRAQGEFDRAFDALVSNLPYHEEKQMTLSLQGELVEIIRTREK